MFFHKAHSHCASKANSDQASTAGDLTGRDDVKLDNIEKMANSKSLFISFNLAPTFYMSIVTKIQLKFFIPKEKRLADKIRLRYMQLSYEKILLWPLAAMVHIRVDEDVKFQAAKTLGSMGLSISDAMRAFLIRVVANVGM